MNEQLVLVAAYHDGSGITSAWGPFDSLSEVEATKHELGEIGITDAFHVLTLRKLLPTPMPEVADTGSDEYIQPENCPDEINHCSHWHFSLKCCKCGVAP